MKRNLPWLVTLEIIDWVNRAAGRGITGVSPAGAKLRHHVATATTLDIVDGFVDVLYMFL
jgi:hypothetical protein